MTANHSTKLATATSPEARENSGLAYDALTNRMLLFGGYAGHYFGDIWQYDTATNSWQPLLRKRLDGSMCS